MTARAASAAISPVASQAFVDGFVAGRNGSTAKPTASTAVRRTALQPIRERAPKQPHGFPPRPREIAQTSASAKTASRAAAASADPGTRKATATASAVSSAMRPAQTAVWAGGRVIPYERRAARACGPPRSLAAAEPSSTAARVKRRRPAIVRGRRG